MLKDKGKMGRLLSPPSYAAAAEDSDDDENSDADDGGDRSRSRSRSSAEPGEEKVEFITSFGGESPDQAVAKKSAESSSKKGEKSRRGGGEYSAPIGPALGPGMKRSRSRSRSSRRRSRSYDSRRRRRSRETWSRWQIEKAVHYLSLTQ